mgnify:CR=1 FL=1
MGFFWWNRYLCWYIMKIDNRTIQQNKAYWKFQTMLADEMKAQWVTLKQIIEIVETPPTATILHETIFKPLLDQMYLKDSTTKMTKEELNWVLEPYMKAFAERWIVIHFPSSEKDHLLSHFN